MKSFLAVVTCLALVAPAVPAMADEEASATAHVFVMVNPNVALQALQGDVDLGDIQTGVFQGRIPWRVDANTQNVQFWAEASGLYKGDDYTDPETPPILVDQESGIRIHIPDGNPVRGEDEYLEFDGGTAEIEGYPSIGTETVEFESSQVGRMSQDIDMYVWWNQDDPEKPIGEYSGMVRLNAMIVRF